MSYQAKLATPFAVLGIRTEDERLIGIEFLPRNTLALAAQTPLVRETCRQLQAYLKDAHFVFDLPLHLDGTAFQQCAWQALRRIPAGKTLTYGELAQRLHTAARAVGGACGANPIPIVVPCHRIVGAHGLGGFMNAGDGDPLAIKRWLLCHEGHDV
ncbi:MAG: methylated-DNA--[protein]-cysteine S-methyltransferase [Pseudomonadota bacterium]